MIFCSIPVSFLASILTAIARCPCSPRGPLSRYARASCAASANPVGLNASHCPYACFESLPVQKSTYYINFIIINYNFRNGSAANINRLPYLARGSTNMNVELILSYFPFSDVAVDHDPVPDLNFHFDSGSAVGSDSTSIFVPVAFSVLITPPHIYYDSSLIAAAVTSPAPDARERARRDVMESMKDAWDQVVATMSQVGDSIVHVFRPTEKSIIAKIGDELKGL
ncbi:hypothetical protein EVAR_78016_1 [Eumeta japonica]|uniref:Uncharacterized protein n=1 Tax=Eumeta variegata TaxID=151549 RepID=A0A4C1T050_EUMVA|nr:hypothetical protein EVAR_78016_1 [Eumeta japonica]